MHQLLFVASAASYACYASAFATGRSVHALNMLPCLRSKHSSNVGSKVAQRRVAFAVTSMQVCLFQLLQLERAGGSIYGVFKDTHG